VTSPLSSVACHVMCPVYQTDDHLREEPFDPHSHSPTHTNLLCTHGHIYVVINTTELHTVCQGYVDISSEKKNETSVQPLLC